MVFRSVCCVCASALIALGLGVPACRAQNPPLSIQLGYDQTDSARTGSVVQVSDYTSIYDTDVAFKVLWNTADSPIGVPYHIWSDDGSVDESGSAPAQTQGTSSYFIPARLLGTVTLNGEAYHPLYGYLVASDLKSESIAELTTSVGDWLDGCPISPTIMKTCAQSAGDAAVSSIFSSVFSPSAMSDYALQYNLSDAQAQQLVSDLRSSVQQQLRPVWTGWVDSAYGIQSRYVIRFGSSSPFLSSAQAGLSSIPQGIQSGLTGLLAPGQDWLSLAPTLMDLRLDTGAITGILLNEAGSYFQTGQIPNLASKYADTVFVPYVGLQLPAGYTSQSWSTQGSIGFGVTNCKLSGIGGESVSGTLGYTYQIGGQVFFINTTFSDTFGAGHAQALFLTTGLQR